MLDADRFMHPGRITPILLPISDRELTDRAINQQRKKTEKAERVEAELPVSVESRNI